MTWMADMISEVETLNNNTPDGIIVDADTILADLVETAYEAAYFEESGIAQEIFDIWKNSADKKSVEKMFQMFADVTMDEYLERCVEEITR